MNSLVTMSSTVSPGFTGVFWAAKIGVTIVMIRCTRASSKLPTVLSLPLPRIALSCIALAAASPCSFVYGKAFGYLPTSSLMNWLVAARVGRVRRRGPLQHRHQLLQAGGQLLLAVRTGWSASPGRPGSRSRRPAGTARGLPQTDGSFW